MPPLFWFWLSLQNWTQRAGAVVRISIEPKPKQFLAMLTLAWLCESKYTAGARGHHGNLPPLLMPRTFFPSAEISGFHIIATFPRSQVSGAKNLSASDSLNWNATKSRRIWVRHKTCCGAFVSVTLQIIFSTVKHLQPPVDFDGGLKSWEPEALISFLWLPLVCRSSMRCSCSGSHSPCKLTQNLDILKSLPFVLHHQY